MRRALVGENSQPPSNPAVSTTYFSLLFLIYESRGYSSFGR